MQAADKEKIVALLNSDENEERNQAYMIADGSVSIREILEGLTPEKENQELRKTIRLLKTALSESLGSAGSSVTANSGINPAKEGSQLVQMRLQPNTMERLEELQALTGITNRTQLVALSIQLAHEIIMNIKAGGKVYMESEDGKARERISIIGI